MTHVNKVRRHYWTSGLVTDDSMADQIIQQYEKMKASSDAPVFLHAVTMQNHTCLLYTSLHRSVCPPLGWMGRHSLLLYLLHQPVIYGVLTVVFLLLRRGGGAL